jgi:outer membrane protein OmpA-like peptidoglycan-associated protein
MTTIHTIRCAGLGAVVFSVIAVASTACLSGSYTTSRDKTAKGAGAGAVAGAVVGAVVGEGHADQILAGAAIGAGIGAGVGSYMDAQEEKLARIPGTTVERVGSDKLLVRFDSDVLFSVDSAILTPDSRATLDDVAVVLKDFSKTAVVVEGFTDSTGSEEHNQALSERRARAVSSYFVDSGVSADRVTSIGFGEDHPVADNDTEAGRRQNRRVAILIKGKAK